MECIFDTCLCGLLYWAFGFAFQFGVGQRPHRAPVLLPARHDRRRTAATGVAFLAFLLFQFAFADTASTVTSGAMVGRTGFKGDILYSIVRVRLHLPDLRPLGLGSGRLARQHHGLVPRPRAPTASSSVTSPARPSCTPSAASSPSPVPSPSGRASAASSSGTAAAPCRPTTSPSRAIGGVILWFGWYGFNPGSTLSAMDWEGIGRVAANTTLAACAGGMVAVLFVYPRSKKWDLGMSINGFLGGLVAITCPVLLGVAVRGGHASVPSPASSCRSASTCSSTCASTTRSVRCRCTASPASGAR